MESDVLETKEEVTILNIIQRIKDRTVEPKSLDKETRQGCVEVLIGEGYSQAQIAQILKCSDKTIHRDSKEIRQKNSITPSAEQAKELIGELVIQAQQHHARLVQMARGEGSLAEKSQAEYLAWKVRENLIGKLQSLGYLPLKPQTIIGDIFHHSDSESQSSENDFKNLESKIRDINMTLGDDVDSKKIRKELKQYQAQVAAAKAAMKIDQVWKNRTGKIP
jgi:transposase